MSDQHQRVRDAARLIGRTSRDLLKALELFEDVAQAEKQELRTALRQRFDPVRRQIAELRSWVLAIAWPKSSTPAPLRVVPRRRDVED